MEAVSTSETSVNFYLTARRNIPEDSRLHARHRENLKSHQAVGYYRHHVTCHGCVAHVTLAIVDK
jgi:hypothetical protein